MSSETDFDLNLLKILDALFEFRSVSKAAKFLNLKQPTVSHALARARRHFDDPLFVRDSKGMTTTRFGDELEKEVRSVVNEANRISTKRTGFDPAKARYRIVIAATDYFQLVAIHSVIKKINSEAPHIQISVRQAPPEFPKNELEKGEFHLAMTGHYATPPEGFFQAALFSDRFVTIGRKGHPALSTGSLSVKEYYRQRHALLTISGDFEEPPEISNSKDSKRNFVFGSSNYAAMGWLTAESDLILTAPERFVAKLQAYFPLESVQCPLDLKPIRMKMYWHERTEDDPLHAWVRQAFRDCASLKL